MHIRSLHLHPLKSCAVLDVGHLDVTPRGPAGDRRWMIVDGTGRFVTARQHPRAAAIRALPSVDGLRLEAPDRRPLDVATPRSSPRLRVGVWKDEVDASTCDPAADAWLTDWLGFPARLVHMDEDARRAVDPAHARPGDEVSFADGYPVLVISQAALDALNARLPRPVAMARFRPNVVVAGGLPHVEDGWRRVRMGGVEFDAVKPCTRCIFTTLDPVTLERDPDGEPLRTLATYRRTPAGVTFGMNLIPRGTGTLRLGDAVEALA